jgi:hypothetical protein
MMQSVAFAQCKPEISSLAYDDRDGFRGMNSGVAKWDHAATPVSARLAGAVSLACWIAIVAYGRLRAVDRVLHVLVKYRILYCYFNMLTDGL